MSNKEEQIKQLTNEPVARYRAWDIRNQKMVENALVLTETQQLVTVNADYFNSPFSFFDGCKWMQSTMRNDINGKEMYEGDLVMCKHYMKDDYIWPKPRPIIRVNGMWSVHLDHPFSSSGMHPVAHLDCEVVGNMFETSDYDPYSTDTRPAEE